ncbi:MAG: transcriptional regulator [Phycisphaerae bacterium]|jgi:predicted DNA-binding transcriptional regulator YafY
MARGEPLIRQWNLLKALQACHFGLCTEELAERLECTKRTVQRDMKVLQDVGFPVFYEDRDFGKRFWRLAAEAMKKDQLMLSMTEMLSLFLSQQLLAPLLGTQFGDGLASGIEKIKAILPAKALGYFGDLNGMLMVKSIAQQDYSAHDKQIRILNQAMAESKVLRIEYHSASQDSVINTLFHPYGLVFFGTNLYCIGYMAEYDEIRTLKVTRFHGVELTSRTFERPANFSLAAHLQGGFGIIANGKVQTIKVRFTGWAATNVREQRWHHSQKIIKDCCTKTDGEDCVIATFDLSAVAEFKRWLLGFGRHAVVQSPKALAAEIKAEFRESCRSYGIRCQGQA